MNYVGLVFGLIAFQASCQTIRYTGDLADYSTVQYWIAYENDLFTGTDRYYTQGTVFGYQRNLTKETKINQFFFPLPSSKKTIGFGLDHLGFTPSTIRSDSLLIGDRPYAATIRLNTFLQTTDTNNHRSLAWSVSLGIIGPEAFGKEIQTGIHRATNNFLPLGWQHQLNTGILLDLGFEVQQRILSIRKWASIDVTSSANLGLGRTDFSLGGYGFIQLANKAIGIKFYARPAIRLVGYDATLQGAIVGKSDEYHIEASQLYRLVSEQEIGVQIKIYKLSIAAWYHFQSSVFEGGMNHRWGGVKLIINVK